MSEVVIRTDCLGKQYSIGGRPNEFRTLRDTLTDVVRAPFRRTKRLLRGQAYGAGDMNKTIWALKEVSFEIKRGQVVGVIGRNGAGKSTLLKILSRITEPTEGYAEIHGRVGSLLEVGTGFHPELTGRENIYLNGAILGMKKVEIDRKFDEMVAFAEIDQFIDTPVKYYSSGMYVRLAFAVAAHLEPEILLVDEVLAVGDTAFQKKCIGKISDVANEGRTVLFVSHNMSIIQVLCDRCFLLDEGQMLQDATPSQVIAAYLQNEVGSGEVSFGTETERSGTGEARYTSVRLIDPDDKMTSSIPMGQSLQVELNFEIYQGELTSPSFGVSIHTALRQPVMRLITRETHGEMPPASSGGTVQLNINRLDLLPGLYYLTVGLSNKGEQVDLIENAIKLEITPLPVYPTGKLPPKRGGFLMFAPCSWSHEYK